MGQADAVTRYVGSPSSTLSRVAGVPWALLAFFALSIYVVAQARTQSERPPRPEQSDVPA